MLIQDKDIFATAVCAEYARIVLHEKFIGLQDNRPQLQSADSTQNGQIQSREKDKNNSFSKARPMDEIQKQISLQDRVSQRQEGHSRVIRQCTPVGAIVDPT